MRKSTKEYRETFRKKADSKGLCIQCARNKQKKTSKLCQECTDKTVQSRRVLAEKRRAEGFCSQCLTKRPIKGKKLCKLCRDRKVLSPEKRRLKEYGITEGQYNSLLILQDERCYICSTWKGIKPLHVDHCHESGAVRGLLCTSCNNGLGRFSDSIESLKKAVKYLQEPPYEKINSQPNQ